MKLIRTPTALVLLLVAACSAVYADDEKVKRSIPQYTYSMHLDIARVLAIDEPTPVLCQVVEARMTYEATGGSLQHVSYQTLSQSCNAQN